MCFQVNKLTKGHYFYVQFSWSHLYEIQSLGKIFSVKFVV